MPTPTKPYLVLTSENKSHRTKSELQLRKKGEEKLSSGVALKIHTEVKNNKVANAEFNRVSKLLENIGKNDALYESVINRYAMLYAECADYENKRDIFYHDLNELEEAKYELIEKEEMSLSVYYKRKIEMHKTIIQLEGTIQQKRKMLLDIEKENIMTIASSLRSIPKKEDTNKSDLLRKALGGG